MAFNRSTNPDSTTVAMSTGLQSLLVAAGRIIMRRRVVLTSIFVVLMLGEDVWEGLRPHNVLDWSDGHTLLGLTLLLCGVTLRSWAVGILRKGSQLTTTGPYRNLRNPLYVGSFMMMLGFAAIIDDEENAWIILGPMLALYYFKVREEEQGLAARFGDQWLDYAHRTPRVFPRRWSIDRTADWQLSQWLRCREYRAALSAMLGVVALYVWRWW